MGGRFGGADHADADDGRRLGDCGGGLSGGALAPRGQGPGRPQVSASAALFRGSQHHLAGLAGGIWQLEQRVEAVLAAEPAGRLRGDAGDFGRDERHRPPRPDGRFDDRARPCLGGRRKRGQHGQALGRSRGGFSTKIHLKTDFNGLPLAFHLTGGEASDSRNFESCSTSVPTSRPGPCSATKATTPRPTERRRAGAASAPSSPTARTPNTSPASFPKSSTPDAPASSRATASSSASNASPCAARRPRRTSPPSSRSPARSSWSNQSTRPNTILSLMDLLSSRDPLLPVDAGRLRRSLHLLLGFLLGCVVAAAAVSLLGDWAWSLPVALAAVAIAIR